MMTEIETLQDGYDKSEIHKSGLNHSEIDEASLRGPLASSVYHDLRHPLTAILAYSELLAEKDLGTAQREDFHNEIRLAVCRMNDLLALLLEFARNPAALRPEVANIIDTVKRAIQAVAVRPEFRQVTISYHHKGLTQARIDSGRLQQVIINLVLNACEAVSPCTGRIDVRSLGRKDCIEMAVWDNGPGIPEPIRQAVFKPFVSYGKRGGTGLGLAIVQKILREQGGEIYLETTGEGGTLFRFAFPFFGYRNSESTTRNPAGGPMSLTTMPSMPMPFARLEASTFGES